MYCKHCGKQIEEDSCFCKYCGKDVSEKVQQSTTLKGSPIKERFTSLPRKYQICIIAYTVWLLVWICVLIGNSSKSYFVEVYVLLFFLFTILLPFVIVSLVYLYQLWKKKNNEHACTSEVSEEKDAMETHSSLRKVITRKSVLSGKKTTKEIFYGTFSDALKFNDFMKIYGPHIEKVWHKNSRTNNEYCTLDITSPSGNTFSIRFHPTLGELSASDIKERKNELFVVKRKDNNEYYLIDNNYEEWYEHLIQ